MSRSLPRFYPILDLAASERQGLDALEIARAMAGAGVELTQIRHKGPFNRAALEMAERLLAILSGSDVECVINDRADVARIVGAAGVHVGQDDLPPAAVRQLLGDSFRIGFSTHNEQQLRAAAAEPLDYVALGPIFGTASKARPDAELGLAKLELWRPLARLPLVAIGGITLSTAERVWEAGADSVAVIADWLGPHYDRSLRDWVRLSERFGA